MTWSLSVAWGVLVLLITVAGAAPGVASTWPAWAGGLTGSRSAWSVLLGGALLGGILFSYWWPRRRGQHGTTFVAGTLLSFAVLILAVPAYVGCEGDQARWWTPVAWTIALFVGNVEDPFGLTCAGPMPLSIQVARLAALLTTFLGLSAIVAATVGVRFDRVKASWARSVLLVAGVDEYAVPLIRFLAGTRPNGTAVVLVHPDPDEPHLLAVRRAGALVVIGDPTDLRLVRRITTRKGFRRRNSVLQGAYVFSSSASVALHVSEVLIKGKLPARDDEVVPRLVVRLDDPWQADYWRRRQIEEPMNFLADAIGLKSQTAQAVIDHLLRRGPTKLIVIGSSPLTLAVLDEIVQHRREQAVRLEPPPLSVTVIGPDAEVLLADHQHHQRRFGELTTPVSITAMAEEASPELLEALVTERDGWGVVATDPPSTDQDQLINRLTSRLPGTPILIPQRGLQGCSDVRLLGQTLAYGETLLGRHPVTGEALFPEDGWQRIARRLHESYYNTHVAAGGASGPSRKPWDQLPDFYRESGVRRVAVAMSIAVEAGRSWVPPEGGETSPMPLTETEVENFAFREHESWRHYYAAHGWVAGERQEKRFGRLRHDDLVPWDQLKDTSRRYTSDSVKECLERLAALGYRPFAPMFTRSGLVEAERQSEPWAWTTESGAVMAADAGDWRLTDGSSRHWSVRDSEFALTYERLEGETYRRTGRVTARPGRRGEIVRTTEGEVETNEDEFVVTDMEGNSWVVQPDRLGASYTRDT